MDLGGDGRRRRVVVQDDIDNAPGWLGNRHLKLCSPAQIQCAQERLDHRRLEAVVDSRPRTGEVAQAQIGAKGHADRDQDFGARVGLPGLDPAEMGGVDPRGSAESGNGDVRIESHLPDVLACLSVEAGQATTGLTSDLCGRGHGRHPCHESGRPLSASYAAGGDLSGSQ